jgi:hypothetical protein
MENKVGEHVWYVVNNERYEAEVIALTGATHARVRLLSGPQQGAVVDAPWGILEPKKT